ncbi:unnamed protein product [Acanthoscelides obtectus]|uniref:Carbohydrate kinase PfkB domain-containing protein n=1 Tax=Acanthoscelides obtectus TaxID=200917 RepID=A0A9P0K060_ACAOB|nr:unnamed protein product [Acanthoscelides obtectus]CAK1625240.1 hypothetical protein AOBTE_LOCUS3052 [Acanthoscelides obtectus]
MILISGFLFPIQLDGGGYPTNFTYTPGGVARNICEALTRLGVTPAYFMTVVGDDDQGRLLLAKGSGTDGFNARLGGASNITPAISDSGADGDNAASWSKVKGIKKLQEMQTASCVIVFDEDKESRLIMTDFDIHSQISPTMVCNKKNQ